MEKLMSIGFAHLALRWSHEMIAHPWPALLPSLHLLRRIFWTLSDDNHSLWIKVHLSPYTSYYLLLYIILIYHVTFNFVFSSVCPLICVRKWIPRALNLNEFTVWWCQILLLVDVCMCVCMILCLLYKKDRNTTRKFRFSAIISEFCLKKKEKLTKNVKTPLESELVKVWFSFYDWWDTFFISFWTNL